MKKILCVCLGNICRSPAAEGILRAQLLEMGWQEGLDFQLDSAGTNSWHVGEAPDPRSVKVCAHYGIDIGAQQARQLESEDGDDFDLILGMDRSNVADIESIIGARNAHKIHMFDAHEVRDPYYSAFDGFEIMYQQLEDASRKWVNS